MGPCEVLRTRNAELLRRARVRVPDEAVRAVDERNVGKRLKRRRFDGPVAEHVGERLQGDDAPAFAPSGKDCRTLVEAAAPVRMPRERPLKAVVEHPELALREVVVREEVELVAVELRRLRAERPRPARFGKDLEPMTVGPVLHRRVESVLDRAPAAAGLDASLVADGVDVREGRADKFGNALEKRPYGAIEVRDHFVAVHDVGLVLLAVDEAVERAAARGGVHRELKPEPCALADGELDKIVPPFGAPAKLRLGVYDVLVVLPVAARVDHEDAAEAEALHRLEVGGDRLAVGMSIDPPPVAPGARLGRRRRERRPKRQKRRGEQHHLPSVTTTVSMPRARPSFLSSAA